MLDESSAIDGDSRAPRTDSPHTCTCDPTPPTPGRSTTDLPNLLPSTAIQSSQAPRQTAYWPRRSLLARFSLPRATSEVASSSSEARISPRVGLGASAARSCRVLSRHKTPPRHISFPVSARPTTPNTLVGEPDARPDIRNSSTVIRSSREPDGTSRQRPPFRQPAKGASPYSTWHQSTVGGHKDSGQLGRASERCEVLQHIQHALPHNAQHTHRTVLDRDERQLPRTPPMNRRTAYDPERLRRAIQCSNVLQVNIRLSHEVRIPGCAEAPPSPLDCDRSLAHHVTANTD